jgi:predicted glycogen debranching enzyme
MDERTQAVRSNLALRRIALQGRERPDDLFEREWLVANGLGGYASACLAGTCTRRYHGLLVAALPSPHGRVVMLTDVDEQLRLSDGTTADLRIEQTAERQRVLDGVDYLTEFRLEAGLPVWTYVVRDTVVEKRLILPHHQNTVYLNYRLVAGRGPLRLRLYPGLHFRPLKDDPGAQLTEPYTVHAVGNRYEVVSNAAAPALRLYLHGDQGSFNLSGGAFKELYFAVDHRQHNPCCTNVWVPGFFRVILGDLQGATLVASTEAWDTLLALDPAEAFRAETQRRQRLAAAAHPGAQSGPAVELTLGADQFIVSPVTRVADATRAHASGDEIRSVIAGYHWFTDWGRDTMISLEGLALATGRGAEAGYILRTVAQSVRNGLITYQFPEGTAEGLYHTADATLWFVHALDRYVAATGDRTTLRQLLPLLHDIIDHHVRGTRFGIGVDPADGLLRQGEPGYQLTWMDAKVGDWVVTPRRGKAVEINALWYNATECLQEWVRREEGAGPAQPLADLAELARTSFNRRFWYERGGHLYDVVDGEDGDDPALRPNQIFAVSLPHPVLERTRWERVVSVVHERLLTPYGLRSLDPAHPAYKGRYYGDLRSRDAAYHQGTVWGWLIGPFVDAWVKVHPDDRTGARRFLSGLTEHLDAACIGSISEVFDAEAPFTPAGCVSQAWSVAEVLRAWILTGAEE